MRERFRALDPRLLWVILALMALGTLTLFSAGRNTPQAGIWLKQSLWNLLGMLLMLRDRAKSAARDVTLANCRDAVKQILDIANFGKLFSIV